MISLEIVATIVFFGVVGSLILLDRKNIQFQYGIVLRRWTYGIKAIDAIVKKNEKFLKNVGDASVVICLAASIVSVGFLFFGLIKLQPSLGIVLPTVGEFRYPGPVISVPFWYWIVCVFVVLTAHESMHALFARLAKVPIRNYGIVTFLVLPIGAFVDPDAKKLKSSGFKEKLRIYAAGSFSNFIVGFLVYLIALGSLALANMFIESVGVKIGSTIPGTPAYNASVSGILYKIDETKITSISDLSNFLENLTVGKEITLYTDEGEFKLKTVGRPENQTLPFIGISNLTNVYKYKLFFSGYVPSFVVSGIQTWLNLLFWLLIFNIGVGIFNMLPIRPLDGGLMYEEIFKKKFAQHRIIMRVLEGIILVLIIFNLFVIYAVRFFI
jgi:Zn-dependent protease